MLLKLGAEASGCDFIGFTPLHVAESYEVAEILLGYGADVSAIREGHEDALELLMDKGMDADIGT